MKKVLAFLLLMFLVFTGIGYAQTTGYIYDFKQELEWKITKHTATAYDGGTVDAHGDHNGTGDPYTIFTVTGMVWVKSFVATANIALVGAATIDAGISTDVNLLATQIADATTWDIGEIWDMTNDPGTVVGGSVNPAANVDGFILDSADIIETLAAANITAGQVDWYIVWAPLEVGASITSP